MTQSTDFCIVDCNYFQVCISREVNSCLRLKFPVFGTLFHRTFIEKVLFNFILERNQQFHGIVHCSLFAVFPRFDLLVSDLRFFLKPVRHSVRRRQKE